MVSRKKEELVETNMQCSGCKGKIVQVKGPKINRSRYRCLSCGFEWEEGPGMGPGKYREFYWKVRQAEYQELCTYHRRQRELTWQVGTILITASLAIFGIVASKFKDLPLPALIFSGFVSIFTLVLFWLFFERISYLNDVVKARMRKIEHEFGMYIVRTYTEEENEYKKRTDHPIGRELRTRWLVPGLVVAYAISWISLWIIKNG